MYHVIGILIILIFLLFNVQSEKNKVEKYGSETIDHYEITPFKKEIKPVTNGQSYAGSILTLCIFIFAAILFAFGC